MTESVQSGNSRVRINLSQSAKGVVQFDITAEFPTLNEAKDNMSLALDQVKALIKEKGLVEASAS